MGALEKLFRPSLFPSVVCVICYRCVKMINSMSVVERYSYRHLFIHIDIDMNIDIEIEIN